MASLDALWARAYLPMNRVMSLTNLISKIQISPQTSTRNRLQLLRHVAACTFVTQHARLCLWCFQRWLRMVYVPEQTQPAETGVSPSSSTSTQLVERPRQCLCRCSMHPALPSHHHNEGCNSGGLGSTLRDPHHSGRMVCTRSIVAHQHPEAEDSQKCLYLLPAIKSGAIS